MKYPSKERLLLKGIFLFILNIATLLSFNATAQNQAEEIIKTALEKIQENYSNDTQYLQFIYRETIQEDRQYVYLGEAVGTIEYGAYQQPLNISKAQHTYQNGDHFNGNFIGNRWHNTLTQPNDEAQIFNSRQSHQLFKYAIGQEITGGPLGLTAYDKIKYPSHFFKTSKQGQTQASGDYQFQLLGTQNHEGMEVHSIQFSPKKISKYEPSFEGTCYVEKNSFAIVYLEYKQTSGQDIYRADKEEFTHQQHTVQLSYTQKNREWHLAHVQVTDQIDWKDAKLAKRFANYITSSELWVNDSENNAMYSTSNKILFPNTLSNTLVQVQDAYQADFWYQLERSALYPQIESKIRNDLERQDALETQFKSAPYRLVSIGK